MQEQQENLLMGKIITDVVIFNFKTIVLKDIDGIVYQISSDDNEQIINVSVEFNNVYRLLHSKINKIIFDFDFECEENFTIYNKNSIYKSSKMYSYITDNGATTFIFKSNLPHTSIKTKII